MIPQTLIQLIESPLLAFLFCTLFSFLFSLSKQTSIRLTAHRVGTIATYLMMLSAALLLGIYAFQILESIFTINTMQITGPYWFAFWYYPVVLLLVQLLWLKKLRNSINLRLLAGVLLCFMPKLIEILVIIITSRQSDYVSSGWSLSYYWPLLLVLINAILITVVEIALWMFVDRILSKKA